MVQDLPDGYLLMVNGKLPQYNTFFDVFKRQACKSGIPAGFTPHSLRHAFFSALVGRGVPITDVAQWVAKKTSMSRMPFTGTWCRTLRTGP
jgi:integrase